MAKLVNVTQNKVIVEKVIEARSFVARLRGLLGRTHLPSNEGMWILQCNSIHTFFMKFPIDLIFVNSKLEVQKIYHNVPAWRVTAPVLSASSVFELAAGTLRPGEFNKGDKLDVRP